MQSSAIITPILAAGSVASPYVYLINIKQKLRHPVGNAIPVFAPTYSLVGFSRISANTYVAVVNVQGLISYSKEGNTKMQMVNQNFSIPFVRKTLPLSVTIDQGDTVNEVRNARSFVSETPIYLSIRNR